MKRLPKLTVQQAVHIMHMRRPRKYKLWIGMLYRVQNAMTASVARALELRHGFTADALRSIRVKP